MDVELKIQDIISRYGKIETTKKEIILRNYMENQKKDQRIIQYIIKST